jgi:glycosyltransferase involved in cell wall biosynthesis
MNRTPHIYITLLDDPVYKQSTIRVAETLARAGYAVTLVGRCLDRDACVTGVHNAPDARPASANIAPFRRVRFKCLFKRGKAFYLEMNLRIFFYLLFHRTDLVCAVNLDTILPCWTVSLLKRIPRVHDARELFTELSEVVARPRIQRMWLWVERNLVPRFPYGYAVCQSIADELHKRYGVSYAVVRNMTVLANRTPGPRPLPGPYLLYQGAVNYGRGLDALIPAMQHIDLPLVICGTGNYMEQTRELVERSGLGQKVIFTGQLTPDALYTYTAHAFAGINLVERAGLNQYFSLPNKLFDYIHAGVPQITMDYPEYRRVQDAFEIGILIPEVEERLIVEAIRRLCADNALYQRLHENCAAARLELNWQKEEPRLVEVFRTAMVKRT